MCVCVCVCVCVCLAVTCHLHLIPDTFQDQAFDNRYIVEWTYQIHLGIRQLIPDTLRNATRIWPLIPYTIKTDS